MYRILTSATLACAVTANAQTCNPQVHPSTPASGFQIHSNGTVFDLKTGLTWQRCALGQTWGNNTCKGTANSFTWSQALQAALASSAAGYHDWRLPNPKELASLVENQCANPAINLTVFPNAVNNLFWTSSPFLGGYDVWTVDFNHGYDTSSNESNGNAVRLVRGGQ